MRHKEPPEACSQTTKFEGLRLKKTCGEESELKAKVYADASYGGKEASPQTGVMVRLAEQPVLWYCRIQDMVSLYIHHRSGVYCGERGGEGCQLSQTVPSRIGFSHNATNSLPLYQQRSGSQVGLLSGHLNH